MLKYQKFHAPISKGDVLSKKDQMSWIMQKPNKKLLNFVIILLWEVIYAHFYNWDRLLDFVSVVYDLIELIIEASLSKDYSTLDPHTQHTSLMFNECLFNLCGLYMFKCDVCVLNHMWIKPKRFLFFLFAFVSDLYHPCFSKFSNCFCVKNMLFGCFRDPFHM